MVSAGNRAPGPTRYNWRYRISNISTGQPSGYYWLYTRTTISKKGFAIEAVKCLLTYLFGELQLHRVSAIYDVENVASTRVLERIGMRREGHYIENIWFKGSWGSEYLYAILDREWH